MHHGQPKIHTLVRKHRKVVDVGPVFLGPVVHGGEIIRVIEKLRQPLEPVFLIGLVGVEDQLDLAPVLEVLTRAQRKAPSIGRSLLGGPLLDGGDIDSFHHVMGAIRLVRAGDVRHVQKRPVQTVRGDYGYKPVHAFAASHALVSAFGIGLARIVDRRQQGACGNNVVILAERLALP